MSKIRERLLYELTREPKERKVTLQAFAGRLLIGFFIMIFLITIVSRFSDSVTIAKISTASFKRGVLNFDIEGSGELKKNAKKYISIYEGVRIKDILVKEGQIVDKGDTLFYYDINDLKNKLNDYEDELKRAEINLQKEIVSNKGKVKAPASGIISQLGITIGSTTTGTEQVTIATGDYGFTAKISKEEADRLAVGDEMDLTVGDSNEQITVPIENIDLEDEDGTIEITGIMPEGEYSLGTTVSFHINKQSEEYSKTIPIQALRRGSDGNYYVLITIEKDSILGTELTSFKVGVNLIDKDYTTAAISGSLDISVNIIVSSNKYIEDGDRVRLEDSND